MSIRLLAALAALLLCATSASADTYFTASTNYDQRIASLESELAAMRAQLDQPAAAPVDSSGGYGASGACGTCCQTACCPSGGWIGGAGFYYIKPTWETNPGFLTATALGGG